MNENFSSQQVSKYSFNSFADFARAYGKEAITASINGVNTLTLVAHPTAPRLCDIDSLYGHRAILHNYPQLRATDLMLFFSRFKAGYYGRFYGTFDPMVVSDALNQFAEWCRLQRGLILTQRHIEQQRHLPPPDTSRCISYSEFLALRSRRLQLRLCRQHFFSRHHCRDQPTAGS